MFRISDVQYDDFAKLCYLSYACQDFMMKIIDYCVLVPVHTIGHVVGVSSVESNPN